MEGSHDPVGELLELRDLAAFRKWLDQHRDELDQVLSVLDAWRQKPDVGVAFEPWYKLIAGAGDDPAAAWRKLEEKMIGDQRLEEGLAQIAQAADEGSPEAALRMIDEAMTQAEPRGVPNVVGALHMLRGNALRGLRLADRTAAVNRAIDAYNESLKYATGNGIAATLYMHLANAYFEKTNDDRHENRRIAIDLLREALKLVSADEFKDQRAAIQTELANHLSQREGAELHEDLGEAVELARSALLQRELDRDPDGWAYSQAVFASCLLRQALVEKTSTDEARAAYGELLAHEAAISDPQLVIGSYFDMARTNRLQANRTPEDEIRISEAGIEAEEREREGALLDQGVQLLNAALGMLEPGPDLFLRARLQGELALVLDKRGDEDDALKFGREALTKLTVELAPRSCFEVSYAIAAIFARREEWLEAADYYRSAVEAGELLFHGHRSVELQTGEIRNQGELGRWAALALSRIGAPEEAVLVLENARTRELRQRLDLGAVSREMLNALPGHLREEYEDARAGLLATPLGPAAAQPSQALQAVLTRIRSKPEFAHFARGARIEDLLAATEPAWPLLYVNPTPAGLLLLLVSQDDQEQPVRSALFDLPTSEEIFLRLMAGPAVAGPEPDFTKVISYLAAIVGLGDTELHEALDDILPWIGELIAKRADEVLREVNARGATLILCGPLGSVPVGAANWREDDRDTCLLDRFDLRYAPSANLARAALARAKERQGMEPRFIALANPTNDLDAAVPEVIEIARHFHPHTEIAEGPMADSDFLRGKAPQASHLHFACHAGGGLFEQETMGIHLADGLISAFDVSGVGNLNTRLVVVSACQTAIPDISGPTGEVFATTTALLAAGSACVVGSLWPVDDLATALLMVRFYDTMAKDGLRPPEALRRAQLWLRDLSEAEEGSFLADHPALAAEARRRAEAGDRPGRRSLDGNKHPENHRPFAEPEFWAPFIAVGA